MLTRVINPLTHPAHARGAAPIAAARGSPRANAPTQRTYPTKPPRLTPTTP
jgi:hypothetical protein